jgi:hypothetical protein
MSINLLGASACSDFKLERGKSVQHEMDSRIGESAIPDFGNILTALVLSNFLRGQSLFSGRTRLEMSA